MTVAHLLPTQAIAEHSQDWGGKCDGTSSLLGFINDDLRVLDGVSEVFREDGNDKLLASERAVATPLVSRR